MERQLTLAFEEELETKVAGVTFGKRQGYLNALRRDVAKGGRPWVFLARETSNSHDPNAIAVKARLSSGKFIQIGYIPRNLAATLAPIIDAPLRLSVKAFTVTGGGKGATLGCRLKIAIPSTMTA